MATTTTASPAMAALAAAVAAAAVAVAVGVAASVGSAASAAAVQASNQANQIQEQIAKFLSRGGGSRGEGGSMNDAGRVIGGAAGFFVAPTPRNDLAIPVIGDDESEDGCGDSSVRFSDGICYPVLKRGPCRRPHFWVTVDPMTLTVSNIYKYSYSYNNNSFEYRRLQNSFPLLVYFNSISKFH